MLQKLPLNKLLFLKIYEGQIKKIQIIERESNHMKQGQEKKISKNHINKREL